MKSVFSNRRSLAAPEHRSSSPRSQRFTYEGSMPIASSRNIPRGTTKAWFGGKECYTLLISPSMCAAPDGSVLSFGHRLLLHRIEFFDLNVSFSCFLRLSTEQTRLDILERRFANPITSFNDDHNASLPQTGSRRIEG